MKQLMWNRHWKQWCDKTPILMDAVLIVDCKGNNWSFPVSDTRRQRSMGLYICWIYTMRSGWLTEGVMLRSWPLIGNHGIHCFSTKLRNFSCKKFTSKLQLFLQYLILGYCFCHRVKIKEVITTFYLIIRTFFLRIASLFVIKWIYFLQFWLFFSELQVYLSLN